MTIADLRKLCEAATQGKYSTGKTLLTRITRRWTKEQWAGNEHIERRLIVANQSQSDEGRGRVHIAKCERLEDAAYIAALSPERILAMLDVIEAAADVRIAIHNGGSSYNDKLLDAVVAFDHASAALNEAMKDG